MKISVCLLLALLRCLPCAWGATPVDATIFPSGTNGVQIRWNAIPGRSYLLQSSTNLSAPWRDALPASGALTATFNVLAQPFATDAFTQFFRVLKVDTAGPEVYRTEPVAGGIAVGRQATLRAWVRDESDLSTNSLKLTIANCPPVALGDPRLRFSNGVLTYTPATNEFLGAAGELVTVSLAAADILGNQTTNFTWSFQLELPSVPSTNLVFIGGGGPLQPPSTLTLLSTNGNTFTYSYTGASSGLATGQFLVNTNLATGYTRAVVSFTNNAVNRTVDVATRPAKLAELLQQGSFSLAALTEIKTNSPGMQSPAATGLNLNFNFNLAQTVFQSEVLNVELLPGSFLNLTGQLELALNIRDSRLRELETKFSGAADFRLEARTSAPAAVGQSSTKALISPVRRLYGGFIGVVPVWIELVYEINLIRDLQLEGKADYTQGVSGTKEIAVSRRWKETEGWEMSVEYPAEGFTVLGPTWQVETAGNVNFNLQAKVTAKISSMAGVSLDLQPYAELTGLAPTNSRAFELSLRGGMSSTIGLDLHAWDQASSELPTTNFIDIIPRTLLGFNKALAGLPRITRQPQFNPVRLNDTAVLSVEAAGETPLSYRWFKNGLVLGDDFLISGSRTPILRVRNTQAYDEGDYQVEVSNSAGKVLSEFTRVLFYKVPSLVKIPAGTFVMGSPFSEVGRSSNVVGVRRDFELQHTVTLTKDFSMGKYEVTQGEYQALMGNNPSYFILFGRPNPALDIFPPIFSAAALGVLPFTYYGIDLTRPVEQVNWYDATSYCERLTATERAAGRLAPGWEYRLPTEAEWEYACRAGTSTTFHYGSELRSGLANFNGHREYPPGPGDPGHGYGADSFSHINPAGIFLAQTTPVGSYQPNGFGLYDMHGNVREWCLDWADNYPSGSVTDPQVVGPPAGLHEHVSRGGDWGSSALACRSAFREGFTYRPDLGFPTMGFRIVLAPVQ